jgi:integral membrane protein
MRRLRLASWAEGATLLLLLLVAVPLKRLAGWPEAVSLMGPLHGAAGFFAGRQGLCSPLGR